VRSKRQGHGFGSEGRLTRLDRRGDWPEVREPRPAPSPRARIRSGARASDPRAVYRRLRAMNENFSLVVMCLFLLASLAFLAQQLTSYH
jgi:hypothetical protein